MQTDIEKTEDDAIAIERDRVGLFGSIFVRNAADPRENLMNFSDNFSAGAIGNGIRHNGIDFITHSDLHHKHSAIKTFHAHQKIILFCIFALIVGGGTA